MISLDSYDRQSLKPFELLGRRTVCRCAKTHNPLHRCPVARPVRSGPSIQRRLTAAAESLRSGSVLQFPLRVGLGFCVQGGRRTIADIFILRSLQHPLIFLGTEMYMVLRCSPQMKPFCGHAPARRTRCCLRKSHRRYDERRGGCMWEQVGVSAYSGCEG